jgi:hypothetical protein
MIQVVLKSLAFFHFGLMVSSGSRREQFFFGDRAATALQMRAFGAHSQLPPSVSASLLSSGALPPAANRRKVSSVGREKERRNWQARVHPAGAHRPTGVDKPGRRRLRGLSQHLAARCWASSNPPLPTFLLVLAFLLRSWSLGLRRIVIVTELDNWPHL